MHCAKCGGKIPAGAVSCPACGLKLRAAPNPPAVAAPPLPGPPKFPAQGPPEYRAPGLPGDFSSPGGYAPGPPPEGPYYSPREPPPPGAHPRYGAPPTDPRARTVAAEKGRFPWAIVAVVVAGLLVIGGSAVAYFKFLRKTSYTGPQAVVARYFEILPGGDTAAIKALFAPDAQPSDTNLGALKMAGSMGAGIEYENPRMKTLREGSTEATVQLVDLTIAVSMAGRSVKQNLSMFAGGAKVVIPLKKVNGRWLLVASNGRVPDFLNVPGDGNGTVDAPPDSGSS